MQESLLHKHYKEVVVPELMKKFGLSNTHQVPSIIKVVINSGINASSDKNHLAYVKEEIKKIAAQSPVTTRAKLSISNFKLREGQSIGVKVTLRGRTMYEFLYRLINIALPCIRDFRGVPPKLDGNGNYSLGIEDHSIFPEISVESTTAFIGMDICIHTSASNDNTGFELLQLLGMPFRKTSSEEVIAETEKVTVASA